jgi:hypothetical protein
MYDRELDAIAYCLDGFDRLMPTMFTSSYIQLVLHMYFLIRTGHIKGSIYWHDYSDNEIAEVLLLVPIGSEYAKCLEQLSKNNRAYIGLQVLRERGAALPNGNYTVAHGGQVHRFIERIDETFRGQIHARFFWDWSSETYEKAVPRFLPYEVALIRTWSLPDTFDMLIKRLQERAFGLIVAPSDGFYTADHDDTTEVLEDAAQEYQRQGILRTRRRFVSMVSRLPGELQWLIATRWVQLFVRPSWLLKYRSISRASERGPLSLTQRPLSDAIYRWLLT